MTTGKKNLRNPVGVDIAEASARADTLGGLQGSDQDAIRAEKIRDRCSLCEELWVGRDIEAAVGLRVCLENGAHGLGGTARHSRFFNDNLARSRDGRDAAGSKFDIAR